MQLYLEDQDDGGIKPIQLFEDIRVTEEEPYRLRGEGLPPH